MSKLKKALSLKTAHGFLRAAIAGMLIFSMLIPTAVSYQQAISSSSENVYSIGDGVDVSLRIRQGESDVLYPVEEIDFEPIVTNNGKQSAWVVLAVKIPSMSQPFTGHGSGFFAYTVNYHVWRDNKLYYPAFFSAGKDDYTDINASVIDLYEIQKTPLNGITQYITDGTQISKLSVGDINPFIDASDEGSENVPGISETYQKAIYDTLQQQLNEFCGYNDNWEPLGINTEYAYQDNGFYIYYYGYNMPVNSGKSVSPFSTMFSANFQDKVTVAIDGGEDKLKYDSDGNPIIDETKAGYYLNAIVKDIDCQYRNCNIGVEAKAYAIQTSYAKNGNAESNIVNIWNENKSKFPAFGSESVVNVVTSTSYTAGEHDVEFVITKDVQSLQIKNTTTGKIVTVADTQSATDTGTDFKTVIVPVNFETSGVYQVSASSNASAVKDDYINAVDMGYIKVLNN